MLYLVLCDCGQNDPANPEITNPQKTRMFVSGTSSIPYRLRGTQGSAVLRYIIVGL